MRLSASSCSTNVNIVMGTNGSCDHPICQMEDSLSPAPATTAVEAPGERGASPGVKPALSGDRSCPGWGPTGREEASPGVESWAAAVPPVRN